MNYEQLCNFYWIIRQRQNNGCRAKEDIKRPLQTRNDTETILVIKEIIRKKQLLGNTL